MTTQQKSSSSVPNSGDVLLGGDDLLSGDVLLGDGSLKPFFLLLLFLCAHSKEVLLSDDSLKPFPFVDLSRRHPKVTSAAVSTAV